MAYSLVTIEKRLYIVITCGVKYLLPLMSTYSMYVHMYRSGNRRGEDRERKSNVTYASMMISIRILYYNQEASGKVKS